MRLAVYTDYTYALAGDRVYAERAFAVFLGRLALGVERFVLIGRLNPSHDRARYEISSGIDFVPLPYYETLARPGAAMGSMARSLLRFWRVLPDVDAVLLLGPHPLAIAFAGLAALRRRRVILGVRQDLPEYTRRRHPSRRLLETAATLLDAAYRGLARIYPTVVVGPALRRRYEGRGPLLELTVSLVEEIDLVGQSEAGARPYDGELTILSVGRLDAEKNPLMLADVLAGVVAADQSRAWRLLVCGEGPLSDALAARLSELGLSDRAELLGYVQGGEGMRRVYRNSHFLLHTSWTEGLPQVLVEACAAGLPVVTTDVGGIREALGDAVVLVSPGDTIRAVEALTVLANDKDRRRRVVEAATAYAAEHTIEREVRRLTRFIS